MCKGFEIIKRNIVMNNYSRQILFFFYIYEINSNDCNEKYHDQSQRPITTRYDEHFVHMK